MIGNTKCISELLIHRAHARRTLHIEFIKKKNASADKGTDGTLNANHRESVDTPSGSLSMVAILR